MDGTTLSAIAGIVLSLALSYIPGLRGYWEALSGDVKRAVIGALLVVIAAAVYGLSCSGWVEAGITCDRSGLLGLVENLIAALIANQSAFVLSKRKLCEPQS